MHSEAFKKQKGEEGDISSLESDLDLSRKDITKFYIMNCHKNAHA